MHAVAPSLSLSSSTQTSHSSQDFDNEAAETLELQDVHFSYPARPEKKVLEGMNLFIDRGQKLAVVGESGSGKSTVMALLERFYDPNEGVVLINGQDMKGFSIKSIRQCIGYVGQEPANHSDLRHVGEEERHDGVPRRFGCGRRRRREAGADGLRRHPARPACNAAATRGGSCARS